VPAIDRAVAVLAGGLLLVLLAVVSAAVVTRGLNDPLIWTDEVSRFLMVWLAALGWIMASRKRAHIRIRFFVGLLPASWQRGTELAMQAAVTLFGFLVVRYGVDLVVRNYNLEATTLPIPMSVMYAPVVVAGFATMLQGLSEVIDVLRPAR
jgi:TRAP-type C4-dicarboxylate transport system permease small subunit